MIYYVALSSLSIAVISLICGIVGTATRRDTLARAAGVMCAIGIAGTFLSGTVIHRQEAEAAVQTVIYTVPEYQEPEQPIQNNNEPVPSSEPARQVINNGGHGSGKLGDYYVEIKNARIIEDYEGNPAIAVTFSWTNNSDKTTSALVALSEKAFQNGIQLESALIMDSDKYDSTANMKDIRPGASLDVQRAFTLSNVNSTIEFEVSEFISFSDDIVSMNFEPSQLQ